MPDPLVTSRPTCDATLCHRFSRLAAADLCTRQAHLRLFHKNARLCSYTRTAVQKQIATTCVLRTGRARCESVPGCRACARKLR
eukprot:3379475-Pleurochrysis_carterae.AAC.1